MAADAVVLASAFEAAPVGLALLGEDGAIETANSAFARMAGAPADQLAGRRLPDLLHPDDRHLFEELIVDLEHVERQASGEHRQCRFCRPDGVEHYIEIALIRPEPAQGWLATVWDIERRRMVRGQRQSDRLFRDMVTAVRDYAIFMLDIEGRVISWNPGAQRIKQYSADEIIGDHFSRFYPQEDVESGKPTRELEIAAEQGMYEEEGWRVRKDGTLFWSSVVITAVRDNDGELIGFTTVTRDVTDRRRQEEALRTALGQAEAASTAKSEFMSRMSHELRTPLNAVIGFTELLAMEDLSATDREYVETVLRAGEHLLDLINEVLDITRVEAGTISLSIEPVAISDVVRETLDMVRPQAAKRGIRIEADLGAATDAGVSADKQRFKQALLNLLSNAVKYNRKGGTVFVGAAIDDGWLRVSVRDTGPGIPDDQRDRIFQPFERLPNSASVEGTGLGLALSRQLVEAMGGQIGFDSAEGGGSTFWVRFPVATLVREAAWTGGDETAAGGVDRAAHTILYVEDNLSNLQLVSSILRHRPGITLVSAMQGSLALELAREQDPDLVLLDLNLPDMLGEGVLAALRTNPATAHIPVVVVSADATAGQIRRLRELGAADYLTKPIKVQPFLEAVDRVLSRLPETASS